MTTDDKSRAAFEKWMSDDGISPRAVERSSDGYYKLMHTSNSWTAWSAAIAYASAEQRERDRRLADYARRYGVLYEKNGRQIESVDHVLDAFAAEEQRL